MSVRPVLLGDLVAISGGGTPSRDRPEFYRGTIPWVTVKDLGSDFFLHRSQEHISQEGLDGSASRLIPAGNVLLATRMAVGRAVINRVDAAINQDLKALLCESRLDPLYLLFFLAHKAPDLEAKATGATVKGITIDEIEALEIPLPDLPEQKRIAGLLEQADRLRRTRRYALELSDTFLPAAFLSFFGDPRTNPKNWPSAALVEVCDPKQWPTISGDELTERGYPVYGANGVIGCYSTFNHEHPTVLLTCRGATCGAINVSLPKSYVTGNAMCLDEPDSSKLTIDYLAWVLRLRGVADTITGSAQPQITRQTLEKVRFPLPPLPQQHHFAALVAQHERLRGGQREALRQAEHLFHSLLHRAFTDGL